ncbi:UDP-diphospho-muramoylpentapeptide beta-N-acetylglucosaminyltransferase [Pseudoflavonifractor sp. BIOML-A4]|nr:UDP-diphospho-muramoylpentapeptide beta-N-acetylglucosaminyltransferase [Pseudoflavonifractor sp. BIOML-A4]
MNILILTGKFGMGHWSASQSLRQQFLREDPDAEAEVLDLIDYAMPSASDAWYKGFSLLVTHGSGLFNTYYKMTENMEGEARPPFEGHFVDKLQDLLEDRRPDLVVATPPLCAQLVSRYKWETGSALPLVTCITDLSVHSEWINRGTDFYLVGTPELGELLAEKGVDRERIIPAGIPVKAEFKETPHSRGGKRRHLLIMGGGLGLLPKKDKFYEELNALPGVKTTIIAGRNEKLRERLAGKYGNIEVVGYTDRVHEYMASADLMLSKPGGITLFEAISSELPLLAWEPFLQQEINNARFLTRAGIGVIAAKETEDCLSAIREVINDGERLEWMADNMRRLKSQLEENCLGRILAGLSVTKGACA